ncbi:MAG: hypothetical protein LBU30_06335 [Candidatus Methanoplasma sp.]|jgi:hypothetical protein|nr:hypothetical protein [Candidatus Methanoplasma sp.]
MDTIMYAAAILAFAPTLILMYAVLRKYTYPAVEQPFFSDPTFFKLFVVGLIAGTLLFAFYTYLNWANMIYAVLFAVVQCLVMVMVMNLKRFHGKSDSVFYGYGLGLGMGCTMAFGTIYYLGTAIIGSEDGTIDIIGFVWLFVISLSHILMLSAIGTTVGEGIARLRPMEFAVQTVFVNVVLGMVLVAAYNSTSNELLFYACLTVALIVAAIFFYYTMHVKLSRVVKDVLKLEGKTRKDVPR